VREAGVVTLPPARRLSNRTIIGLGLALCILAALLLAWYLEILV
jgi:hypothetical protein